MSSACSSIYLFSFVSRDRRWTRFAFNLALAIFCVLACRQASYAQSTFGTVLGLSLIHISGYTGRAGRILRPLLLSSGADARAELFGDL